MDNKTITFYYYTAWNGFAWQGCDEATADSLQLYMEATKTLPKSSADRPPFGGAVPCKINGTGGVAVYRYHTREKGDLSGRDSLYIALAFVPLGVGCVDFAKLLDLPQLAIPVPQDKLKLKEQMATDGLHLDGEIKLDWQDKGLDDEFLVLGGTNGLQTLSRLFFSEKTQLGFLNAVFRSDSGKIDDIESAQTYSVCPQVKEVAAASDALESAKKQGRGTLAAGHPAFDALKDALADLDKWAKKQPDYHGLRNYHNQKENELNGEAKRLQVIQEYMDRLQNGSNEVERLKAACDGRGDDAELEKELARMRYRVIDCAKEARKVLEVPVLNENDMCRQALRLSLDALETSAYVQGVERGLARLRTVTVEKQRVTVEWQQVVSERNRLQQENEKLGNKVKELTKTINHLPKDPVKVSTPSQGRSEGRLSPLVSRVPSRVHESWWTRHCDDLFNWAIWGMGVVTAVVLVVLIKIMFFHSAAPTDLKQNRVDEMIESVQEPERAEPSGTDEQPKGERNDVQSKATNVVNQTVPGSSRDVSSPRRGRTGDSTEPQDKAKPNSSNDVVRARNDAPVATVDEKEKDGDKAKKGEQNKKPEGKKDAKDKDKAKDEKGKDTK